jgi:hypothetical protein
MTNTTAPAAKYNVRSAHGRIHILTAGRQYKIHGTGPYTNRPDSECGKADCGALTSASTVITTEPSNCPKCIAKN